MQLRWLDPAVTHQPIPRYTPTTGLTGLDEDEDDDDDDDEDEKRSRATLVVPLESSGQDKVLYKVW
uniref:Uncharacterized protein n=1 Tax=Amphimedon queenslandica TaxID=400682 RepID=A0A1X7U705_AMPQE